MFGEGRTFDVVVVGASFGGLAVALQVAGAARVLLIDRDPPGEGQTSACATPLPVLERLDLLDTVEQVHDHAVFHLPGGRAHRLPTRYPFATFDYSLLCRRLFERTGADFVQASATSLAGTNTVLTSRGEYSAPILVDASGWRAVLAADERPAGPHRSLAIELRLAGDGEGLHFWLQHPAMRDGYLWDFPAGDHRRVGVITYGPSGKLRHHLEDFLSQSVDAASLHGGGLPAGLPDGVARDRVFLVGDAAAQCLPLTGEGIRPALVFGQLAGRLIRRVLAGELSMQSALDSYRRAVRRVRPAYSALSLCQVALGRAPRRAVPPLAWLFGAGPLSWPAQTAYWAVAPPELVSAPAGEAWAST